MGLTSNYIGVKPNAGDEVVELKTGLIGTIIREYTQGFLAKPMTHQVQWHRYICEFSGDRKKLSKTKLYRLDNDDLTTNEILVDIT